RAAIAARSGAPGGHAAAAGRRDRSAWAAIVGGGPGVFPRPQASAGAAERPPAPGSFPLADLAQILGPGRQRRVGEIGEQAVQTERVVLEVLLLGVAVVVGRQPAVLVAEREGVDK